MFRDRKDTQENLKDPERNPSASYGASPEKMSFNLSYNKTNKLITALYMVTDIVDREEPLRNKLRTLGVSVISDIHSAPHKVGAKIPEIMSFLGIARALNIISAMNCDILEKEFQELDRSIKELGDEMPVVRTRVDLAEFLRDEFTAPPTRLGVQRGSTLLGSLEKMSKRMPVRPIAGALKGQRRKDILNIIKINGGSATIKDIKDKASNMSDKNNPLVSMGEKTLQRELISMIEEGVLYKEGAKRWSRYFLKTSPA